VKTAFILIRGAQEQEALSSRKATTAFAAVLCLSISLVGANKKHKKPAIPISEAENCDLTFAGSSRKDVKLRTVEDGKHYSTINGDQPISVAEWLSMACSTFDPATENKAIKDAPIKGVETQTVTIEGFLMAARFENGGDHDIHAEIADEPTWSLQNHHVIVEVPPGQAYCSARKQVWDLVVDSVKHGKNYAVLENGPRIAVTGYVFLDTAHGGSHFCTNSGGRGIKDSGGHSDVQGLWELHPVLEVQQVR
jgi:hypothetical protein